MKIYFVILSLALLFRVSGSPAQSYVYDDAGRLRKLLYSDGRAVEYKYDLRDNLIQVSPTSVPAAVENVSLIALSPTQATLSWEYDGVGILFQVQSRLLGTPNWIDGAGIGINARTTTVSFSAGENRLYRIVVLGGSGTESVPSDEVKLPSTLPLLVTTTDDEDDHVLGTGTGDSLREVIEAAVSGDLIRFSPALSGQTILLRGKQLSVNKSLIIDGSPLPLSIRINAAGQSRVFGITSAKQVVLKKLTISGGNSSLGGGVFNEGVELTLQECLLSNNQSPDQGGGLYNVRGGSLNLVDCLITGNSAREGGGIYHASEGHFNINQTTLTHNEATLGDGGGIYSRGGLFLVKRSTFSGNAASSRGGGFFHTGFDAVVENCTIAGNSSGNNSGGGLANEGDSNLVLRHCTIAENVGLGIWNVAPAELTLDNTIAANNFNLLNSPADFLGDYSGVGLNLVRVHTGTRLAGLEPLTSDPILGPLSHYYGRTQTMAPLPGSPALDAGIVTPNTPSTDQGGDARSFGLAPDLGSVESRLSTNTDLAWVTTSAGTLSPTFRRTRTNYTATVTDSVPTAAVRAATGQFGQTLEVRINGGPFSTIQSREASPELDLNPGENLLEVKVTAENGITFKTYLLTVIRGAAAAANVNLASLTTSSAPLNPTFDPATKTYHAVVSPDIANTTVTATAASAGAHLEIRNNLGDFIPLVSGAASIPLALHPGANAIDLRVTAEDGATTALYTIVVTREAPAGSNARLADLSISAGELSPAFDPGVAFYSVRVNSATNRTTVTPTAAEAAAIIRLRAHGGNLNPIISGAASAPIDLDPGANLIEVNVTAEDGVTVNSYTLVITRVTGGLEWASQRQLAPLAAGDNRSGKPSISSDGRFVAFSSRARNLVADDTNNSEDIFVYDRSLHSLERVSVNNGGEQATYNGSGSNADSRNPSVSSNGRYIAFQSRANNLVADDTNGQNDSSRGEDIFVHDRVSHTTERVSLLDGGAEGNSNGASETPSISGDGRFVAFASGANNLVPGYANGEVNVYVHDRTTRRTVGISVPFGGFSANRNSLNPVFSTDGIYVAFEFAVDKSIDNTPAYQYRDIYLYNRATRTVERVTGTEIGPEADGSDSRSPSISADGRYVAFQSNLEYLDFYDLNSAVDVFVFDRTTGSTRVVSVDGTGVNAGFNRSINPSISGNGRVVAFESSAMNLVTPNANGNSHIFLKDWSTGEISLLSAGSDSVQAEGESGFPSVSFDGLSVAFQSDAPNLVEGDNNQTGDVFIATTAAVAPSALAGLASLTSNLGVISPEFSPGLKSYYASVSEEIATARLQLFTADPGASLQSRVNGSSLAAVPANRELLVPLELGTNLLEFVVTAADSTTEVTYSLSVNRVPNPPLLSDNANLASLVPGLGILSPDFDSETAIYSVVVPSSATSISISPSAAQPDATLTVNDEMVASGTVSTPTSLVGSGGTFIITVTAQDGVTTKTYAVAVTREPSSDAELVNLVPSDGVLVPPFDSNLTEYTADVPNTTEELTLTPTAAQADAVTLINGRPFVLGVAGGPIELAEGNNLITVRVVAQDGLTEKSYVLTVTRAPRLNLPPVLANVSEQTVDELTALALNLVATDPDLPANLLTFGLVSGPTGLTVSGSGAVAWTPGESQGPTTHTIVVKVTDNGVPALSATNQFAVLVRQATATPLLRARVEGTRLVLTWRRVSLSIHLEKSDDLSNPSWQPVSNTVDSGLEEDSVSLDITQSASFYRLSP